MLCQALPHLLGPLAGTVVDRIDLKRVLVSCELGQAAIFAVIAFWEPPLGLLLPLIVLGALLDTSFGPASGSAVPALVGSAELRQANAWLGTSLNLQVVLGPLTGGILVSGLGARWALLANAASFAASAAFLVGLPLPGRARLTTTGIVADLRGGLRFAWSHPSVRALLVGTFLMVAFLAVDNVALVFLTRDVLHTTAFGFGAVAALFGAGMLLSSVLLSWLHAGPRSVDLLLLGWTLGAVGTLGTGLAPNLPLTGAGQAIGGIGNGLDNIAADTLIQEVVPTSMLGRIFGLFSTAAVTGSVLAYAIAGILVDVTSPRVTFLAAGLAAFVTLLLAGPAVWRVRSRPIES